MEALKEAKACIKQLDMALANAEDEITAAKARIAELEAGLHKKTQEFRHLLKAGFAEMEAARPAPVVTPEWLAKAFRNALASECETLYERWDRSRQEIRNRYLSAACVVVKQMPKPAPVVDVERLRADYHTAPYTGFHSSIKHALEAQGVRCK